MTHPIILPIVTILGYRIAVGSRLPPQFCELDLRPTEATQFVHCIGKRRIERKGTQISGNRLVFQALELQPMTELEVGVGDAPVERQRLAIGELRSRQLVGVAQLAHSFKA